MTNDPGMFLAQLGTIWEIDPKSMTRQTRFHILLMLATIHMHHLPGAEFYNEKIGQEQQSGVLL